MIGSNELAGFHFSCPGEEKNGIYLSHSPLSETLPTAIEFVEILISEANQTYFQIKKQNESGQESPGDSMGNWKRRSELWLINRKMRR